LDCIEIANPGDFQMNINRFLQRRNESYEDSTPPEENSISHSFQTEMVNSNYEILRREKRKETFLF
jgi:hypothetical protein